MVVSNFSTLPLCPGKEYEWATQSVEVLGEDTSLCRSYHMKV